MAMIVDRIISSGSKLSCVARFNESTAQNTLAEEQQLGEVHVHELYLTMGGLLSRQKWIQNKLAKKHLSYGTLMLFDVSSSYYTGGMYVIRTANRSQPFEVRLWLLRCDRIRRSRRAPRAAHQMVIRCKAFRIWAMCAAVGFALNRVTRNTVNSLDQPHCNTMSWLFLMWWHSSRDAHPLNGQPNVSNQNRHSSVQVRVRLEEPSVVRTVGTEINACFAANCFRLRPSLFEIVEES